MKSKELECMQRNATRTGVDCNVDIEFALKALNKNNYLINFMNISMMQ
ncbi:MAG: hypothetical protein ACLU20_08090 [Thomasclavelia spiroformis]